MKITVNSAMRDIALGATVADLVAAEGLSGQGGVAIAVNGAVVRKAQWGERALMEGDDVVIIHAAYGG